MVMVGVVDRCSCCCFVELSALPGAPGRTTKLSGDAPFHSVISANTLVVELYLLIMQRPVELVDWQSANPKSYWN